MKIENTNAEARYPWPEDMFIQGGNGVVLARDKPEVLYRTKFVEAFPEGTFLRGEGDTLAEAEDKCWAKYQKIVQCPTHPDHGPFERRHYRNGSGYCIHCGSWFSKVLPPLPEDENKRSFIDQVFRDPELAQQVERVVREAIKELPDEE